MVSARGRHKGVLPAAVSQQPAKSGGVVSWWRNKFSKRNRKSTPSCTNLNSVPEDSLATPSKAPEAALGRGSDADSANDSPKIHVARQSSFTQGSDQPSMVVQANELYDANTGSQPQGMSAYVAHQSSARLGEPCASSTPKDWCEADGNTCQASGWNKLQPIWLLQSQAHSLPAYPSCTYQMHLWHHSLQGAAC